jgi:hypothetical protein
MIASIDITFCDTQLPSDIFSALREAGWGFRNDTITYACYHDIIDFGGQTTEAAPTVFWPELLQILDAKVSDGATVFMPMYWGDSNISLEGNFWFSLKEELHVSFYGDEPSCVKALA